MQLIQHGDQQANLSIFHPKLTENNPCSHFSTHAAIVDFQFNKISSIRHVVILTVKPKYDASLYNVTVAHHKKAPSL
jgi:hypothetical protein